MRFTIVFIIVFAVLFTLAVNGKIISEPVVCILSLMALVNIYEETIIIFNFRNSL